MPSIALHTVLHEGRESEYVAIHRAIPTSVVEALKSCRVTDWRIWRDGLHVFHLVEVEDYAAMRSAMRDLPANQAWQKAVGGMFAVPDSYEGGDTGIDLIWSLAAQINAGQPSVPLDDTDSAS
jgi:L-rhamnose mutarotase